MSGHEVGVGAVVRHWAPANGREAAIRPPKHDPIPQRGAIPGRDTSHGATGALCQNGLALSSTPRQTPKDTSMSSELIKHVSDASFDSRRPEGRQAGAGGLLGRVVRPVQDDRADPRRGLRRTTASKLQIAKMNVDENRDVPAKFGIRGIPTLMLFKDGQLAATKVGALSKAQLTAFLDGHL